MIFRDKKALNTYLANNRIFTLDLVRKEAEGIASSWHGGDDTFFHEGEKYYASDADLALDLLKKLDEVEEIMSELRI